MNLGALIRKHRKERKLILKTVAEKAGISEGFLSQVENSVSSPSVDKLISICNAIGINAGDLLNRITEFEKLVVIRKSEWDEFEIPHSGFLTRRFFAPDNRSVIDSAILVVNPDKSIPVRKDIKDAQELLCVLKGTVELVHGEQTILLTEGDSVHYWSDPKNQRITNRNKDLAIILWVGTI